MLNLIIFNVAIPIIFLEGFYVILFMIPIIIIESIVIFSFLKRSALKILGLAVIANVCTTLIGYLVQGIARLILLAPFSILLDNEIIRGIAGNIGATNAKSEGLQLDVMCNLITSLSICFLSSVGGSGIRKHRTARYKIVSGGGVPV